VKRPARDVRLRPLPQFGDEVQAVLRKGPPSMVLTSRAPGLLNYYLRYPAEEPFSGWALCDGPDTVGFALLGTVRKGPVRQGKVIECYLASEDPAPWHAAYARIVEHFREKSVAFVTAYASTSWACAALRNNAFHLEREHDVYLRDPKRRVPRGMPFYISFLEADNGLIF
jgi:hypothetical protein